MQGDLLPHSRGGFVTLSPNGQWIASSGWHSPVVKLWNARTGKLMHDWTEVGAAFTFFTPDNRKLIISRSNGFSFWDVETFQMDRQIRLETYLYPGQLAFSSDEKLMAVEIAAGVIQLSEIATGRPIAKLQDPFTDRVTWMAFTREGTELVVAARYSNVIHIWNLRAIRARLKSMDLDWDWPEFSPVADPVNPGRYAELRLRIKVVAAPTTPSSAAK